MTCDGIIVYKLIDGGSKSEKLVPFLYKGRGEYLKVWKKGDVSWLGEQLEMYDGIRITADGEINEYDVFLIEEIKEQILHDVNNISTEE